MNDRDLAIFSFERALDGEPSDVYTVAHALELIGEAYREGDDHYIRWASIVVLGVLATKRQFGDVARALAADLLDYDRDQANLEAAAGVYDAFNEPVRGSALREEAKTATNRLVGLEKESEFDAFAKHLKASVPSGAPSPNDTPEQAEKKRAELQRFLDERRALRNEK